MDNNKQQLKLRRISTIFRSCRNDDTTTAANHTFSNGKQTPSPPSKTTKKPPTHPFPSIHKSNNTPKFNISPKPDPARQKLSESSYNYSLFYSAHSAPLLEKQSLEKHTTRKQSKRAKKTRRKRREVKKASRFVTSSEDDEVGSRSYRRLLKRGRYKAEAEAERNDDCYAIVKCSKDPYMDFRTSMVEMIVEKRMRKAEDLERLLQCFLKINSYRHHPIIIEAFMEIWDALFFYA